MHHIAQIDSNAITTEERERRGAVLWGVSGGEAWHSAALGAWAWETRRSDAGELGGRGDELGGEGELGGGGSKLGSEGMAAAASELVGCGRARRRRTQKGGRGHNGVRVRGLRVTSEAATSNSEARAWAQQRPSSWAAGKLGGGGEARTRRHAQGRGMWRRPRSEATTTSMARAARTRRGALGNGRGIVERWAVVVSAIWACVGLGERGTVFFFLLPC